MTTTLADDLFGGIENAFRTLDLGGLVEDVKDIRFAVSFPETKIPVLFEEGFAARECGDHIRAVNTFLTLLRSVGNEECRKFILSLKDYSEERIHHPGLPTHPVDDVLSKKVDAFRARYTHV